MPVAIAECGVRRFPVGETNPRIVEYNNQTNLFGCRHGFVGECAFGCSSRRCPRLSCDPRASKSRARARRVIRRGMIGSGMKPVTKSVDRPTRALYCGFRNIQEARLLITIFRLVCAVLVVLSSSLKFLSLRIGAFISYFRNSHGYRYC